MASRISSSKAAQLRVVSWSVPRLKVRNLILVRSACQFPLLPPLLPLRESAPNTLRRMPRAAGDATSAAVTHVFGHHAPLNKIAVERQGDEETYRIAPTTTASVVSTERRAGRTVSR